MIRSKLFLIVFVTVLSGWYGGRVAIQPATDFGRTLVGVQDVASIIQSQDNRDPKEINSSAESRKRRKSDQLQRSIEC